MTRLKFEELNLSQDIINAVKDMGFEEASPIQSEAIPYVMQGRDIVGQAQTGTGKTAAFGIPVIEKLDPDNKSLQAVILCPTRELVIQVSQEFRKLMKYKEALSVVPVYGGQQIDTQFRALKKRPQVVIGTPGRFMDHMRRGSINISEVTTIVLDEADEMLDMGFRDDIEFIFKETPAERQTIMFSATMAKEILDLTKKYQNDPVVINVINKKLSAPKIQQIYFEIQEKNRPEALARLIDMHNIKLALVFCNTKSQVDLLVEILKTRGYFADALHGDMSQNTRDKVMNGFRNGSVEILVATDVAGRGIDVNNVEAVFNYDLPRDDEDYIHRIGRTARAGKSGMAFTFISGKQIYNLKRIERANGMQIQRQSVPTMDDLEATRINSYVTKVNEVIAEGHLSNYINHIELISGEDNTSLDVAAALLKIAMEKDNEGFDPSLSFDKPPEFNEDKRPRNRKPFGNDRNSRFDGGRNRSSRDSFPRRDRDDRKPRFENDGDRPFNNRPPREAGSGDSFPRSERKPRFENDGDRPFSSRPPRDSFPKRDDRPERKPRFENDGDRPFSKRPPREAGTGDSFPKSERKPKFEGESKPFDRKPSKDDSKFKSGKFGKDSKPDKNKGKRKSK